MANPSSQTQKLWVPCLSNCISQFGTWNCQSHLQHPISMLGYAPHLRPFHQNAEQLGLSFDTFLESFPLAEVQEIDSSRIIWLVEEKHPGIAQEKLWATASCVRQTKHPRNPQAIALEKNNLPNLLVDWLPKFHSPTFLSKPEKLIPSTFSNLNLRPDHKQSCFELLIKWTYLELPLHNMAKTIWHPC